MTHEIRMTGDNDPLRSPAREGTTPYNAGVASHNPPTPALDPAATSLAAGAPRVRTVVATELLMLLGLLAFVGAAYGLERYLGLDFAVRVPPLGAVVLAGVPALLWLGYFYLQDRLEPEPKAYVFGVFLLGVFVAAPVAGFVTDRIAASSQLAAHSLDPLGAERIVYAMLVVAVAQELCKYAVVRYAVYPSPEFDEPLDGIVYATAAGIGFACHETYHFLEGSGGEVLLSAGAATAVITTLAHASFAGVTGYALGRAKFIAQSSLRRTFTLLGGLAAAIALNGLFALIRQMVESRGIEIHPWRGVAFTFGFAAVVFIVVSLLARRLLLASPHRAAIDLFEHEQEQEHEEDEP